MAISSSDFESFSPPPPPPPNPNSTTNLLSNVVLPSGWSQRVAKGTGTSFYVNEFTGQRSYTLPTSPAMPQQRTITRSDSPVPSLFIMCCRALAISSRSRHRSGSSQNAVLVPRELADDAVAALFSEGMASATTLTRVVPKLASSLRCFAVPINAPPPQAIGDLSPLAQCTALTTLCVRACSRFSPRTLEVIAENCPALQVYIFKFIFKLHQIVDVSECPLINTASIEALTSKAKHLLSLSCTHCMSITGVLSISNPNLVSLAVCSTLTGLNLDCPMLEHLDCTDCWDLSSINTGPTGTPQLSFLYAFRCFVLEGASLLQLLGGSAGAVVELNITECKCLDSLSLAKSLANSHHITHLTLSRYVVVFIHS